MAHIRDVVFQLGKETDFGVAVPAAYKMTGDELLKDARTIIQPDGYDSIAGSAGRWVEGLKVSRYVPPERPLTFEEAPIYFSAGLGNNWPATQVSDNRYWDGLFHSVPSPLTLLAGEYLYIGFTSTFRGVRFILSQLSAVDTTLTAEYSTSSGWAPATTIYDASRALRQTGVFEISPPSSEFWTQTTEDFLARYWLRVTPSGTADLGPVIITTLDVVPLAVTRSWSLPSFAIDKINPATYTMETGVSDCAFRSDYCFVESFILAMAQVTNWRHMHQWWGRHYEILGSPTSPVGIFNQEDILAANTKFYLNDSVDGPGATEVVQTLQAFNIFIKTGLFPVYGADGKQVYYTHSWGLPEVNLSLVLECNEWLKSEIELRDSRADPPPTRLIRIQSTGCEIIPGVSKSITIDLSGTWNTIGSPRGDDFGDLVSDAEMFIQFFPLSDVKCDIEVVNTRAAIP